MNPTIPYIPISDERIAELTARAAKVGARIYIARRIYVKQDRDWDEAINLGAPQTHEKCDVRNRETRIEHQALSNKEELFDIILLNYLKGGGDWDNATTWARESNLDTTNSREVLAVGESIPSFYQEVKQHTVYIVSTLDHNYNVGHVRYNVRDRFFNVCWVRVYSQDNYKCWFAYRERLPEPTP